MQLFRTLIKHSFLAICKSQFLNDITLMLKAFEMKLMHFLLHMKRMESELIRIPFILII